MTPRIAVVHERFTEYGGSEAVVAEFLKIWPSAAVYAPIATADCLAAVRAAATLEPRTGPADFTFHTSWLSRAHALAGGRSHAPLLPFVPATLRRLPVRAEVDALVISHHSFATQAALAADVPVIAYVHSPARWAWDPAFRAREAGGRAGQAALAALGRLARRCESRAAPRLTHVVANSRAVADRVGDWWGLPATVVNPPVRIDRFAPDPEVKREDFFLVAGRLVPYKRADLAVRAARRAGCRLVVLGDGRFRAQLASIAGPETTFLGAAPDEVLLDAYRRCRALLMPGVEDFGIVPVEAMACGTPVLAVGAGGALDTVRPGLSGELLEFGEDDAVVSEFARAMREFDPDAYDPDAIRAHAESYSPAAFRTRIASIVDDALIPKPDSAR
ncbi:glycosyltransferase [Nocardia pseudobrasiliensis]|uniref:Glycosyltransferase involved in cell wall biosynthesis n=1 Tax=Nocardia pseudobrasiliensis TaxID=45979 RepID=A0A370IAN1_9NOCA|nr:glycosyltransferase [Nocardia pseudobrasiliensis]RDI67748.1 glycosyltransferase involved in cell wall biosynthesis [Nocardia pseudobrasiliensis]